MDATQAIQLAEAAAQIVGVITNAIQTGKAAYSTNDIATLKDILDPLHAQNMANSAALDAMLDEAAKQ